MCTLTVRFDPEDDYPLVVAANRDELYNRDSMSPSIIERNPSMFAPKDLAAGGTWLGVNELGLFVAITNVWMDTGKEKTQGEAPTRSRGLLTLDVLGCSHVADARKIVRKKVSKDTYQFFNLLVASTDSGAIFSYSGKLNEYPLTTGNTTVLNCPYDPSTAISDQLPGLRGGQESSESLQTWLGDIKRYLSQHPRYCKHGDSYGTRSSQVVVLGKRDPDTQKPLHPDRFWYAGGAPCETDFVDLSVELQTITQTTRMLISEF